MSAALHPMLNTAVKAARRAGSIINRASLDLDRVKVSRKTHNDFVTEIDEAAEKAIIDVLLTAYPDHSILAEESGRTGSIVDKHPAPKRLVHRCSEQARHDICLATGSVRHDDANDPLLCGGDSGRRADS